VAVAYQENQVAIYEALMSTFSEDLQGWDAQIDKDTLTFVFSSPEVLFKTSKKELSIEYMKLLQNFFPRYLMTLGPFKESITEVRIEGHTSSVWNKYVNDTESYFKNMELSQGRTRSVLEYVYRLNTVASERNWIKKHVAAVGFSSAKLIKDINGKEDRKRSRRVTFRVITNADIRIKQILGSD
jgi:outer membrane protein OmpA-like peptidoglycan-associated protein